MNKRLARKTATILIERQETDALSQRRASAKNAYASVMGDANVPSRPIGCVSNSKEIAVTPDGLRFEATVYTAKFDGRSYCTVEGADAHRWLSNQRDEWEETHCGDVERLLARARIGKARRIVSEVVDALGVHLGDNTVYLLADIVGNLKLAEATVDDNGQRVEIAEEKIRV